MRKLQILVSISVLMIWTIPSKSQTVAPIYKVAVGDTLLIDSNSVSRYGCGQMNIDLSMSSNDSTNFSFRYSYSSDHQTVYYWIYFTPKVPGTFHGIFHLLYYFYNQRCNLQDSAKLEFLCKAVKDSNISFKPYTYYGLLSIDTVHDLLLGRVDSRLHNWTTEQLIVDSIQYLGSKPSLYSFALDSTRSGKSLILTPNIGDNILPIYIFSKDGPGYTDIPAQAILIEHIGNSLHIDTLQFILSSPQLCCQAEFFNTSNFQDYYFYLAPGKTADTSVTITYTRFVTGFTFDSVSYPFSIYSIEDQPSKKILHIRCHPSSGSSSANYESPVNFRYKILLFNGDSSYTDDVLGFFVYWELPESVSQTSLSKSDLTIVPNPANKIITVSLTDYQGLYDIAIYSITGSLVKTLSINSFPAQINLSGLSPGSYYLQAKGKQRSYTQKFIVE